MEHMMIGDWIFANNSNIITRGWQTTPISITVARPVVAARRLLMPRIKQALGAQTEAKPIGGMNKKIKIKARYSLDELIANTDFEALNSDDAKAWLGKKPVGRELL